MFKLWKNVCFAALISAASLAALGCGNKENGETRLTPVQGTVFLDRKPLAHAEIAFHFKGTVPESYQGAASRSNEDGVFQIKSGNQLGTLTGPHIVTVSRSAGGPGVESQVELPELYAKPETSKLQIDVRKDQWIGYDLQLSTTAE